ncbi:ORF165 [Leucania separata nucleopolyhedrovirus]|uniref:ORF165 n=1 Tax=Leucania separata nucleopolyhedrovirus TaxID=1307956 RepID=Q0IKV4_NPVLS|nr:ORF165 [Leucania separata nucleopolyhedrovirus]AAR28929.1 ORF165 [Leucania separata nucleopolyhedrovirus]
MSSVFTSHSSANMSDYNANPRRPVNVDKNILNVYFKHKKNIRNIDDDEDDNNDYYHTVYSNTSVSNISQTDVSDSYKSWWHDERRRTEKLQRRAERDEFNLPPRLPEHVTRYVPQMSLFEMNRLAKKHESRHSYICDLKSYCVSRRFCACTGDRFLPRQHLYRTLSYLRWHLNNKRFVGFVFSLMYVLMMKNMKRYPPMHKKYVCQKCTMLKWWVSGFNDSAGELIMYVYRTFIAPSKFCCNSKSYIDCIENLLIEKLPLMFAEYLLNSVPPRDKTKVHLAYLNLLYYRGKVLCNSSTSLDENILIKLYFKCKETEYLRKLLPIFDAGLRSCPKWFVNILQTEHTVPKLSKCTLVWNNKKVRTLIKSRKFCTSIKHTRGDDNAFYREYFFNL